MGTDTLLIAAAMVALALLLILWPRPRRRPTTCIASCEHCGWSCEVESPNETLANDTAVAFHKAHVTRAHPGERA